MRILAICVLFLTLLLTATISSAQVKLDHESLIFSEQSQRYINPWSAGYAQNTKTGETLIIWYEWNSDATNPALVGRIVDAEGQAVGKTITIATQPQDPRDEFNCCYGDKVTYNPVKNEYLVTYSEGHGDDTGLFGKIIGVRITAKGRVRGKVDLTSRYPDNFARDNKPILVKSNPNTGEYLQFFLRHTIPADRTTVGFVGLLSKKGKPVATPLLLDWYWPDDFTFLPSGKMLLATTRDGLQGPEFVITTVDDPSNLNELQNLNIADWTVVAPANASRWGGPFFAHLSADSPVVYYSDQANIKGRRIDAEGNPEGASFNALKAPGKSQKPIPFTAAFSTTENGVVGVLIALEDQGYPNGSVSVWAQALNKKGKAVGSSKKLYTTTANERIDENQIFALPVQPGDTEARFVWYGIKGDPHFINTSYGILKLNISLPLP